MVLVLLSVEQIIKFIIIHCSDVRSKAFQAVDQFLQIVKQHDEQV